MKVRIIKSSHWHSGMVGRVVNVVPFSPTCSDGYFKVDMPEEPFDGNGLFPGDYEIVLSTKIVEHDGVKYEVPEWAKFLTRDASVLVRSQSPAVIAWAEKPEWNDLCGYKGVGERAVAKPYVEPKPEGHFFKQL